MKKRCYVIPTLLLIQTLIYGQIPNACPPGTPITPAESCAGACVRCEFSEYSGSTVNYGPEINPPGFCSNIQNDQWMAFVAGTSHATILINASDCLQGQGVQAAIYKGSCSSLPLDCNPGCGTCMNTPILFSTDLIIGETYYLVIDGYSGDLCDFNVSFSPAQQAPSLTATPPVSGPSVSCAGHTEQLSVEPVSGASFYVWECSNPQVLINGQPGPLALSAFSGGNNISFQLPASASVGQTIDICVTPVSSCDTGSQQCHTITLGNGPQPVVLPAATVCHESLPYPLPWGEEVDSSGVYVHRYPTNTDCDSIVYQPVIVLPVLESSQEYVLCNGDSLDYAGVIYYETGIYQRTLQSLAGCDSTVILHITVLQPDLSVQLSQASINCFIPEAEISTTPGGLPLNTTTFIRWKNLNTGGAFTGNTITVTGAANFEICQVMVSGTNSCSDCDTVQVTVDSLNPPFSLSYTSSGPITCAQPEATLTVTASEPNMTYKWKGPDGFSSISSVISTSVPGNYNVTVTNSSNCIRTLFIQVEKDISVYATGINANSINCYGPASLYANTTSSGQLFLWNTPDGMEITSQGFYADVAGEYSVTVTNPANGCTWTGATVIIADTMPPMPVISVNNASPGQNNGSIILQFSPGTLIASYVWLYNGAPFPGQNFLANLAPGTYTLFATGLNGCEITVPVEVQTSTGVSAAEQLQGQFKAAPNPANESLELMWTGQDMAPELVVRCFNSAGKMVFNSAYNTRSGKIVIPCASWASGHYTIELQTSEAANSRSFIRANVIH